MQVNAVKESVVGSVMQSCGGFMRIVRCNQCLLEIVMLMSRSLQ